MENNQNKNEKMLELYRSWLDEQFLLKGVNKCEYYHRSIKILLDRLVENGIINDYDLTSQDEAYYIEIEEKYNNQNVVKNNDYMATFHKYYKEFIPAFSGGWTSGGGSIMTKSSIEYKNLGKIVDDYINKKEFKQIILTGAPGTGKTYSVRKVCGADPDKMAFVQFHPSYDYSDFVEGLRPVIVDKEGNPTFVRLDGVFKAFCRKVVEANYNKKTGNDFKTIPGSDEDEKYKNFIKEYKELEASEEFVPDKYFFVIDEINRADLSKVFGELMYCLEDSYRGLSGKSGDNLINTQYSNLTTYTVEKGIGKELEFDCFKEGFFIPKNIYIIGTMNDIDRSVEAFDFALRRRFEWVEIKANEVFFEAVKEMFGLNDDDAQELTDRVTNMNEVISNENNPFMLTEAYHIGHAYFKTYDKTNADKSLEKIFDTNITSILKEYTRGRNTKDVEEYLLTPCRNALLGKK